MSKRSSNTKSRIVSAAWELFYSQGFDSTTVDEIVELSGTSKGSFYHYFDSKDALLSSLSYLFDEKYDSLQNSLDYEGNVFETLIYLNQELFDMIENRIEPSLLSRLYSTQLASKGDKSLLDQSRLYYRLLRKLVLIGQERGEITNEMSANDVVRLYAMCERAIICEWCLCDWNFSLKYYAKQMLPQMLSGIRV